MFRFDAYTVGKSGVFELSPQSERGYRVSYLTYSKSLFFIKERRALPYGGGRIVGIIR